MSIPDISKSISRTFQKFQYAFPEGLIPQKRSSLTRLSTAGWSRVDLDGLVCTMYKVIVRFGDFQGYGVPGTHEPCGCVSAAMHCGSSRRRTLVWRPPNGWSRGTTIDLERYAMRLFLWKFLRKDNGDRFIGFYRIDKSFLK